MNLWTFVLSFICPFGQIACLVADLSSCQFVLSFLNPSSLGHPFVVVQI